MRDRDAAIARLRVLQRAVAGEKAAIKQHKQLLRAAAATLQHYEAECRRLGIVFTTSPRTQAQELIHGRTDTSRS